MILTKQQLKTVLIQSQEKEGDYLFTTINEIITESPSTESPSTEIDLTKYYKPHYIKTIKGLLLEAELGH